MRRHLSRRQFLSLGAAGLVGFRARAGRCEEVDQTFDCIVLGAGIAGIAAARDLDRAGFRTVVLEGSQRIGGRMFTSRDFITDPDGEGVEYPVERGAEYVHVGNTKRYQEFHQELAHQGFSVQKFPKLQRNRLAFPLKWKRNPKKLLWALLSDTDLLPAVTLLGGIDGYDRPEDMSVGSYIQTKKFKANGLHIARYTLSSHTPGYLFSPSIDVPAATTCPVPPDEDDSISVAGIRADHLPAQLVDEMSEYKLVRLVDGRAELPGYDALPNAIARELLTPATTRSELHLGHRVVRVERTSAGIAVETETATGERRRFLGRSAISTFSIGMLDPDDGEGDSILGELLDADKRAALRSVRMGPITKFSLQFKRSHWGGSSKMTVMSHPTGCARTFFSAFPGHRKGPFVLTGLLMNRDHDLISDLNPEQAVRHILRELQGVFDPRGTPWTPESVLMPGPDGAAGAGNYLWQDWEKDVFAKGGNSFIRFVPGVATAEINGLRGRLRDPLSSLPLFWAGEATAPAFDSRYQPLSVHGAYISGVGVAKDVAEFLRADGDLEAFRTSFEQANVRRVEASFESFAGELAIAFDLSVRDAARVEAYAASRGIASVPEAALELIRTELYLERLESDAGTARRAVPAGGRGTISGEVRSMSVVARGEELERLTSYAEARGWDVSTAARHLVLSALKRHPA